MSIRPAIEPAEALANVCRETGALGSVRAAFVMAHPDDETVGASVLLSRLDPPLMVYVTDGAPRDGADARAAGFRDPREYASAREKELKQALRTAGKREARIQLFDICDQEASDNLGEIARRLFHLFRAETPELVVTHPYEGGHPDHDATAFAVHAACELLEREGIAAPGIVEMTSYHNLNGGFRFGEFLEPTEPEFVIRLSSRQRELKQKLIECYTSQLVTIGNIALDTERYRIAPTYDFTQPPHPGQLLYEMFPWRTTGARWRVLASAASEALRQTPVPKNTEKLPADLEAQTRP